jgi:hypothetical protein
MKSLLITLSAFFALSAHANEVDFEIYRPEKPNANAAVRPAIPKLTAPSPLASVTAGEIQLQWNKVEDATAYAVQVSADPIFFTLLVNEPLYKETSYTIKDVKFEAGKNYYWRVAAVKENNKPGTIKSLFNRSSFTVK